MSGRESPHSAEKSKMEVVELPISSNELDAEVRDTAAFDDKATRRLLRKMDFYLIPFLALLYL